MIKEGIIFNVQKGLYNVYSEDKIYKCKLRGKLFQKKENQTNILVVGDKVEFVETLNGEGVIKEILPRKSKLSRKGAGKNKSRLEQLIAANIDYAIIVCSVNNPVYKRNLIDRYIVISKKGNIEPIICFNKIDLDVDENYKDDATFYEDQNIQVYNTSIINNKGINELSELLKNKISIFVGQSGVGKSSLVNAISNNNIAKTSFVSEFSSKGRHTTTSSQIYLIGENSMIVDTPGIRELGIYDATIKEINEAFQDVLKYAKDCKFKNCSHTHEPDCEVKSALSNNLIDKKRVENYIKLIKQI